MNWAVIVKRAHTRFKLLSSLDFGGVSWNAVNYWMKWYEPHASFLCSRLYTFTKCCCRGLFIIRQIPYRDCNKRNTNVYNVPSYVATALFPFGLLFYLTVVFLFFSFFFKCDGILWNINESECMRVSFSCSVRVCYFQCNDVFEW